MFRKIVPFQMNNFLDDRHLIIVCVNSTPGNRCPVHTGQTGFAFSTVANLAREYKHNKTRVISRDAAAAAALAAYANRK